MPVRERMRLPVVRAISFTWFALPVRTWGGVSQLDFGVVSVGEGLRTTAINS